MSSLCVSSCVLQSIFVLQNVNPEAHINELQLEPPHPKNLPVNCDQRLRGVQQTRLHGRWQLMSSQAKLWLTWTKPHPIYWIHTFRQRMQTQEKLFGWFLTGNVNHASWTCFRLLHLLTEMEDDDDVTMSKSAEHSYLTVSSLCAGAAKENVSPALVQQDITQ